MTEQCRAPYVAKETRMRPSSHVAREQSSLVILARDLCHRRLRTVCDQR